MSRTKTNYQFFCIASIPSFLNKPIVLLKCGRILPLVTSAVITLVTKIHIFILALTSANRIYGWYTPYPITNSLTLLGMKAV